MDIALTLIKAPKIQLRPVRKKTVDYHELLYSVKKDGILQPILVRPSGDAYEVVEGNWRRSAAIDAGLETIPCLVRKFTDDEVMLIQLKANAIRPATTKSEYAVRLQKIMKDKEYTVSEMVRLLNKDAKWIRRMLRLNNLDANTRRMVDRGEIQITNAYQLAKLPEVMRAKFIPQAVTLPTKEFSEYCRMALKDWREFCQKDKMGWSDYKSGHVVGFLRQKKELDDEVRTRDAARRVLKATDANTPMDGWRACMAWLLHLDPESVSTQEFAKEGHSGRRQKMSDLRKQNRVYLEELRNSTIGNNDE
jgi:ParB/RepB/Spo0J family partition protein